MKNELTSLGKKIRGARESQRLSIRDLADMAVNKSQIVRVESGQSDPHYTTLFKFAQALGVNVGILRMMNDRKRSLHTNGDFSREENHNGIVESDIIGT